MQGDWLQSPFGSTRLQWGTEKDMDGPRKCKERKREDWRVFSPGCGHPDLSESPMCAHKSLCIVQLKKMPDSLSVPPPDWYSWLCLVHIWIPRAWQCLVFGGCSIMFAEKMCMCERHNFWDGQGKGKQVQTTR